MKMGLSDLEGRALHGLIEEASGDIVVRLDAQGFMVHASDNISDLGYDISGMLVMPHVSDLAEGEHGDAVSAFVEKTMNGDSESEWCEFPVIANAPDAVFNPADYRRWYALSLRPVRDESGVAQGALGLLRSVQHKRVLEGELHSRAVTDPLTGLANRQAFCASLRRHLAAGGGQHIAVLAVDSMRAMFMQYGQRTADEIMWGFAKFLETMALPGHEIAQLDNERFAVILPNMSISAVREWAGDVLKTFSALALPSSPRGPQLSASAGVATVECTVDWTLRQAELSLVMARAGGGMQVGNCGYDMAGVNALYGASTVGVAASAR
ncbi:sensor domain-containing diguanylate cyclase [Erythrobacter rubeus]|uniref:Diguanylate cyclase n=1 Tax=Erythrobacter rubeus TaxID=2760803 RepID=A0ABR8KW94_9SPHN|nr:sensor domain-containing diguanylate cyclase [Erythrobacter rubeus]MBD2843493.1 diguanylate cyclase [Erythrobacter rubeus]